jgi:DNA-binding transcriptional ArsR family regulator
MMTSEEKIVSKGIDPEKAHDIFTDLAKSELAVDILGNLWKNDENYVSQIARDLDKSQTSIDRLIRQMREAEIVKISKEGQSVYYRVNVRGLSLFLINSVGYKYYKKALNQNSLDSDLNLTDYPNITIRLYLEIYLDFFFDEDRRVHNKTFKELILTDFISVFDYYLLTGYSEHFDYDFEKKYLREFVILYKKAFRSSFSEKAIKRFNPDILFGNKGPEIYDIDEEIEEKINSL